MKLRTYKKWRKKGRQVQRGEKAVGFNDKGKALFSRAQTKPRNVHHGYGGSGDYDGMSDFEREWDMDFACAMELY